MICRLDRSGAARGFTLMELLVVISVISILAVLILTASQSSLSATQNVKCLNNLRQVGRANLAFSADNLGFIASGGTSIDYWWLLQIRSYLDGNSEIDNVINALICPADKTKGWGNPPTPYPVARRSYGVNSFLRKEDGFPKKLVEIASPSKIVYAGETGLSPGDSSWVNGSIYWLDALPRTRHSERANYVFLDGHAEGFKIVSLYPGGENQRIFTGE